jgi:hypothetical protein
MPSAARTLTVQTTQRKRMAHDDRGYSIHDEVFDPLEMIGALETFREAGMRRTKAGARHVLNLPIVRMLANDSRLLTIAAAGSAAST